LARRTRILLFSPELRERTYQGRPPIYYLSSVLRADGYTVVTADVDIIGRRQFVDLLKSFCPDIVAGSSLSVQINDALALFGLTKFHSPNSITVLGGSHATAAGEYLYPLHTDIIDAVVVGEGLTTIRSIAGLVERSQWASRKYDLPGLLLCDGDAPVWGPPALPESPEDYIQDLSYHHDSYDFEILAEADGKRRATFQMMTAFGCQNACFFCFSSTNLRGESRRTERRMSIAAVDRALSSARRLGFQAVYFDDDTFTRVRSHAIEVARLCKKYDLIFGCHTRPDCEDPELIAELARCGCRYMFSGLESVVSEILLGANKTRDPVAYRDAYRHSYRCKADVQLPTSAFLIHGMPRRVLKHNQTPRGGADWSTDCLEDSFASIDFAVFELDPAYLSMNILRFIPGVPFSESSHFEFLRPVTGKLHGGYFDATWLKLHGLEDPRCFHPILRAFEGAGSPIPRHMAPDRCYKILDYAVRAVNEKNQERSRNQTQVVVDPWFRRHFLKEERVGGRLTYALAPFDMIDTWPHRDAQPGGAKKEAATAEF